MTEESAFHTPPSDDEAERKQASILPAEPENEEARARPWPSLSNLQDRLARFQKSAAGRYWRHLSTADFMNRSFACWALAVLSVSPRPTTANVPCRRRNGKLHHRSWSGLGVLLLGSGHLRAEELRAGQRRHRADHLPRRLRRVSPCRRGLRAYVERMARRARLNGEPR